MRDLYREATLKILTELKAGVVPWRKPWSTTPGLNTPCNAVTNREYHGVNKVLLWLTRSNGWPVPRFLTYKQAGELGGRVKKGEHGTKVYFVKDLEFSDTDNEDESGVRRVRMLKEFTVFNVAQCEGLPVRVTEMLAPKRRHNDTRDPLIDEFLTATNAKIREDDSEAKYIFSVDLIGMPPFGTFDSASAFYGTLFHELAHWTGHPSRLNRDLSKRFTKLAYAGEELIAELAAAFLCAEFSIDGDPRLPGYIGSYIKLLEDDTKAFFTCASKAQAVVDYLRDLALREPAQAAE